MEQKIRNLKCLGCGAPISPDQKRCRYCKREIYISSFSSVLQQSEYDFERTRRFYKEREGQEDQPGLDHAEGMCYLRLSMYDEAYACFEKAIRKNFDDSETYFLAAIALLKGKNPFRLLKKEVDTAMTLVKDALSIEAAPIYYYFLAYLTYDYYGRKLLRAQVPWQTWLQKALEAGVSQGDREEFHKITHTKEPDAFRRG